MLRRDRRRSTACALAACGVALASSLSACSSAGPSESGAATGSPTPGPARTGSSGSGSGASGSASGSAAPSSGAGGSGAGGSGAAGSTAPSASTSGPVPKGTRLTLAASGDILVHYPVQADAAEYAGRKGSYDFDPMFAKVRKLISGADLAICHQETPISRTDSNLTPPRSLIFNAPPQIAKALKHAGFDGCDTSSNHSFDHGVAGIRATNHVLHEAGLLQAGPSGRPGGAGKPAMYHAKGITVANLAYSYTILNNWGPNKKVPDDAPWLRKSLWPARGVAGIKHDAERARAHGADLVVVSLHAGAEYQQAPTPDQLRLAKRLLGSGAVDLILGDHVHVVQPCQRIHGRYVLYGMGNFLSNQAPTQAPGLTLSNQDGSLNLITFTADGRGGFRQQLAVQPTFVRTEGHVIQRATPTHYPDSWARTKQALKSLGPGACDVKLLR